MSTHQPITIDCPVETPDVSRTINWLSVAAVATWLVVGVWPFSEMIRGRFAYGGGLAYTAAFAINGAAMLAILFVPRVSRFWTGMLPLTLTLVQSITAIAMNLITVRYIHGSGAGIGLLVIIAAELPYFASARLTWSWIATQTVVITVLFSPGFLVESLVNGVAIGGFQVFAAASSMLALREGRARTNLARANAELTATRDLLAENSRAAERLRISRDLHDTLGHHLTALSLQLDVASRLSEGKAADHIRQAHAITKLLLGDVRDVVSTLRETSKLNLAEAIRALAVQPSNARIHLAIPDEVVVDDAARAEAILRAVQEVLTNAARHAMADNLWLRLEPSAGGLTLVARDDGRGAKAMTWGNGLRGMRERFEAFGGRVEAAPSAEGGFEVRAFMPLPAPA